ncbi:LysR family transcriptional regulator [Clostridium sp. MSJ-4]|uniref:LysR family transcriptional regulator n=1 Tax=Clostridium simiarum TaxID=2841506 RepID=A0ABS6F649_9CLOT|nr:LysR family transcriptional regulator [Clostridium simiarum]MBU5593078.1 LysR family transcriptional regulator [Clostridium simiarum]
MTIRHLRIFIEVADSGKMSIAASKFFISQPTVSQTIKELEEHYGVLLFERLSKKLYITEEGRQLLSYARQVVSQFDNLEEKMLETNHREKIRIGATITVGNCILADIINSFKESNPEVEVCAYVSNTKIIQEKLLKSELDIAIVEGKIKSPDLICLPAVDDYLVLACSKNHPFAKKKKIKLTELSNVSFAMREQGSGTRELFENYISDHGVDIKTVWEGNCPGAIKNAVMQNQYLAVISVRLVEEEIKNGEIYVIQNSECEWDRHFSMVYHKNKFISEAMKNLMGVVKNYKDTDVLQGISTGKLIKG